MELRIENKNYSLDKTALLMLSQIEEEKIALLDLNVSGFN